MSPGAIRFGGISIFISIGLYLLALVLVTLGKPQLAGLLIATGYGFGLYAIYSVRGYFAAAGYRGANGILLALFLLLLALAVIMAVLLLIGRLPTSWRSMVAGGTTDAVTVIAIILQFVILPILFAILVLTIYYASRAMAFAKSANGNGIWQAIAAMIFFVVTAAVAGAGVGIGGALGQRYEFTVAAGVFGWMTLSVVVSIYVVYGVGLILGARQLERIGAA